MLIRFRRLVLLKQALILIFLIILTCPCLAHLIGIKVQTDEAQLPHLPVQFGSVQRVGLSTPSVFLLQGVSLMPVLINVLIIYPHPPPLILIPRSH